MPMRHRHRTPNMSLIKKQAENLIPSLIVVATDSETLKLGVAKSLGEMESLDWLVPPMLQKAETLFN